MTTPDVDSTIHLYAICDGAPEIPAVEGVDDAALEAHVLDGLTLVISRHDRAIAADEAALVRHAAAVDAVAAAGATLLPARYGRAFPDEAALDASLRERAAAIRAALEHVAGCVELGVRAADPKRQAPRPDAQRPNATAYMRERLADVQQLERVAAGIHEPLAAIARDSVRRLMTSGRLELTAAYLVSTGSIDRFRAAFDALAATHSELAMVCSGPWPPYSFATLEDRK